MKLFYFYQDWLHYKANTIFFFIIILMKAKKKMPSSNMEKCNEVFERRTMMGCRCWGNLGGVREGGAEGNEERKVREKKINYILI